MVAKLTFDTTAVRDLWDEDRAGHECVTQLLNLASAGDVDLAVTRYIHDDIPSGDLAGRINGLHELQVSLTGGVFTLGVSRLGSDRLGDERVIELQRTLASARNDRDPKPPGAVDWMHLHAHLLEGRTVFLTSDKAILRIADKLLALGVVVMTPCGYLATRDAE
jgi:hypothetical protein